MLPVKLFNFLQSVIFDIFERITTNDNWVISQRNRIDFFLSNEILQMELHPLSVLLQFTNYIDWIQVVKWIGFFNIILALINLVKTI